jgi:hypothetical protein
MTTTATRPGGTGPAGPRPRAAIAARTLRKDRWWLSPLAIMLFLIVVGGYLTVRIFIPRYYFAEQYNYLTPVFSPCVSDACVPHSSHLGVWFPNFPALLPLPILIFPILLGFRATCYYYRKAYYRSAFLSPPACAVPDAARSYKGETRFPFVLQNLHRYFFYVAAALLLLNTYDAAMSFHPASGGFGFGLGSLILVANVLLLWAYTLSCHACRHITGGRLKHFSRHPLRYRMWTFVSRLNLRHGQYALWSLAGVAITDFYIMAVSAGWISDLRFIN